MKLLHNLVSITPEKPEEKTASGIYMTEQIKTYPPFGRVMAVADGITEVKVGDRVVFAVYAGLEVAKDTVLVPIKNILAVVDEG